MSNRNADPIIVICDASPLIFLAKIDGLVLVNRIIPGRQVVLACVVREVLGERAGPVEAERLRRWLEGADVVDYEGSVFPSLALSRSDQSTLAWAVENRADWLLADERLLRRFAKDRGIGVIGFCGVLVKAVERGFLQANRARQMLDAAVDEHGLMISIVLYRRMIEELAKF
jgi:predicted nucleic acid-binding protein